MTDLSILNHSIRTHNDLYSLNDLHKASGEKRSHQPANFIRLDTTQELITEIKHSSDMRTDKTNQNANFCSAYIINNGGRTETRGTWVCKELVYAYAMWISAKFHLQVIRAFDAMMLEQQPQVKIEHKETVREPTFEELFTRFCTHEFRILTTVKVGQPSETRILKDDDLVISQEELQKKLMKMFKN